MEDTRNIKKVKEKIIKIIEKNSESEEQKEEVRKNQNGKEINNESNSEDSGDSEDFKYKDKNKNKVKQINTNKAYKYDPKEKYQKDNSPFGRKKNFIAEQNKKQDKDLDKKKSETDSDSNSDSDSNDSKLNNKLIQSLNKRKQNEEKIKKDKSDSSSSSSSSSSKSPPKMKSTLTKKMPENNLNFPKYKEEIKIKIKEIPVSKNEDKKFLKDKKENEDNIEGLLSNVSKNLNTCEGKLEKEMEEIKKHKDFFEKNNFILTDLSCKRMAQIIHYIKARNPVLLEGDTGTAKTRTSVIACEYLMEFDEQFKQKKENDENSNDKKEVNYIKFNLSAETKIDDLMDKYVGDSKSVYGIKIEKGAFYKAFDEGKILILDEINLAPKEVLECIGQSLDNKVLSTELTGKELKSYPMHHNFALIATQNPLKGSFLNKRQNLGYAFFSRFQKVNCEKFNEDELFEIAKGLSNKEKINIDEMILRNIIKFHMEWEKEMSKDSEDIFCYTIREIETVLNALKEGNNSPYSIIMNIYGARYPKKEKEKIKAILNKEQYDNLRAKEIEEKILWDDDFPICYKNNNLIQAINSILFSLKNLRHIVIVGETGSGITQVARWSAEIFSKINNYKDKKKKIKEPYLCICSKKLQCEDLIGITVPNFSNDLKGDTNVRENTDKNYNNEILKFKEGFLVKAIKKGRCVIFDQINEAPSTVYERLNGLLDKKYNDEDNTFPIPECSEKENPKIKKNFRIICTCNISQLKNISPAFLSRFDIIYLENQLDDINDNFKELVNKIFLRLENLEKDDKKRKIEMDMNNNDDDMKSKKEMDIDNNDDDMKSKKEMDIDNNDDLFESKEENKNKDFDFSVSENLKNLIINKIKILKAENFAQTKYFSYYSFSYINKFCFSVYKLLLKFREKRIKEINEKEIVNVVFDLIFLKDPDEIRISKIHQ